MLLLLQSVELRTSPARSLLLTSQGSGDALESQFERPEMGAAARRRLSNNCQFTIAAPFSARVRAKWYYKSRNSDGSTENRAPSFLA
jgi:hypothetical protein